MSEYRADRWQIKEDRFGYPSIYETDEDGKPGDLVAHCFADHEHLICAAPELLEALQLVWDTYGFDPSIDSGVWQTVRAALNKATKP